MSLTNRSEGVTVREWCGQQGITKENYYYRLRQVRRACLETVPEEQLPQSVVPVPQGLLAPKMQALSASGLDISVNGFCIHVAADTPPELLSMVLEVAGHAK